MAKPTNICYQIYQFNTLKTRQPNESKLLNLMITSHLLHIEDTRLAVKSLSSQWLSENLLPSLFATRQVITEGIS